MVSNRVPLPSERGAQAGGLAIALADALRPGTLWFGWSGRRSASPKPLPPQQRADGITYATIDFSEADYRAFYVGFANGALWPLLHFRLGLVNFEREDYEGYRKVNRQFAESLVPLLRSDDLIWIHDYHLIPLAEELRRLGVRNRIGFFLHTPFPPTDIMVALPHHEVIVRALCCYDLIGLQTENGVRAFLDYIAREANGRLEFDGSLSAYGKLTRVVAFPIGIDTEAFARSAVRAIRSVEARRLNASVSNRRLIIGVDRMDYSKGVRTRFEAIDDLLTE